MHAGSLTQALAYHPGVSIRVQLSETAHARPRRDAFAILGLWLILFPVGMALHESLHALAVLALGSHPVLVLRPWPLSLLPLTIPGIHIQPVPDLDPTGQFVDNLLGPGLAAAIFAITALRVRHGVLRAALAANVLGLLFFALIESADVALDGRIEAAFLTSPEFNYGVPLLLALVVAATYQGLDRARGQDPSERRIRVHDHT